MNCQSIALLHLALAWTTIIAFEIQLLEVFSLLELVLTSHELVSLVKVWIDFFAESVLDSLNGNRCFFFSGAQSVDTLHSCTTSYLLAEPACLWCLCVFYWLSAMITLVDHFSICVCYLFVEAVFNLFLNIKSNFIIF